MPTGSTQSYSSSSPGSPSENSDGSSNLMIANSSTQFENFNGIIKNYFNDTKVEKESVLLKMDIASCLGVIPKNEPESSSSSNSVTPLGMEKRVPACSICGMDSTGIHFGVDACAACSAFFRRTVVLGKQYSCAKGDNCIVVKSDSNSGQKCRACRFKKCLSAGMDRGAVQHRRDAIGRYAAGVKRENNSDIECTSSNKFFLSSNEPTTSSNAFSIDSPSTSSDKQNGIKASSNGVRKSILHELISRQKFLLEQRHLFYSDQFLIDWFKKPDAVSNLQQPVRELTNFSNCMYHLWKVEPRLAADFINRNRYLHELPVNEKLKLFKHFVVTRQAVEEPYLTWKHGGLENQWFVMPNNTYIDFTDPEKYFKNGALSGLKLDLETTRRLFLPSFMNAMDSVGNLMRDMKITETELIILLGLVLFDPSIGGLKNSTRHTLGSIRDQLIQDIFVYYEDEENNPEPEIRIADLFMILAAVKIHSIKTSENMQILRIFELIPPDPCFDQLMESDGDEETY